MKIKNVGCRFSIFFKDSKAEGYVVRDTIKRADWSHSFLVHNEVDHMPRNFQVPRHFTERWNVEQSV